jgi:hypothetical protein
MSDATDLEQQFTITVLEDFATKTHSDCSLILEPLGDGIGWRVSAVTSSGLEFAKASASTPLAALDKAVARALENITKALAEGEDDEADDRA